MASRRRGSPIRQLVLAFSVRSRRRKADAIVEFMAKQNVRNVVFVGCSAGINPNEMIVERAVAAQAEVLAACDLYPVASLPWPFLVADGRRLPFPDGHTDMVLANAVIEHVGGLADQLQFVNEQTRVARCWVITTPNRWFPVESHTSVLLLHWSRSWRAKHVRKFTRLLSLAEFRDLLPAGAIISGHPWSATFTAFYVGNDPDPRIAAELDA